MKDNPFFKNFNQPYDSVAFNNYKLEDYLPAIKHAIK